MIWRGIFMVFDCDNSLALRSQKDDLIKNVKLAYKKYINYVISEVMGIHDDFRKFGRDAILEFRTLYNNIYNKKKTLSARIWLHQCLKTPSASQHKLNRFVDSRLSKSMACVQSHGSTQGQQRPDRISSITRQKAVTSYNSLTGHRS